MRLVARLVLVVMLATFLSPSFAWHMHAGHHEIAHTLHGHGHDHDGDSGNDAHASIGHLLGHLAMHLASFRLPIPPAERFAPQVDIPALPLTASTSPPYRPPL